MAVEVGVGYITLLPTVKGLSREIDKQLLAPFEKAGKEAGKLAGDEASKALLAGVDGAEAGRKLADGVVAEAGKGGDEAAVKLLRPFLQDATEAGRKVGVAVTQAATTAVDGDTVARKFVTEFDAPIGAGAKRAADSIVAPFDEAGKKAGKVAGENVAKGVEQEADGEKSAGGFLEKFKSGKIVGLAAIAGAVVGASLAKGISDAVSNASSRTALTAQLGLDGAESARLGKIAGELFVGAYGESLADVNNALRDTVLNLAGMADRSDTELQRAARNALNIAQAFGEDTNAITSAAGQLVRTGLAKNVDEAFNIITRGFQTGANRGEDFLDTIIEYSVQFEALGLTGEESLGLVNQLLAAGARNSDLAADAIKEFAIRAKDGSSSTQGAFEELGLNAERMTLAFAKGGPAARRGLQVVLDALHKIEDPAKRAQIQVALFGTQAEDLQAAFSGLDPENALNAIDGVTGATERLDQTLGADVMVKIEAFKRRGLQGLANFAATYAIPALEKVIDYAGKLRDEFQTGGLQGVVDKLTEDWKTLWPRIKEIARTGLDALGQFLRDHGPEIGSALLSGLLALEEIYWTQIQPEIIRIGGEIAWDLIKAAADKVWEFVTTELGPGIKDLAEYVGDHFIPWVVAAAKAIEDNLPIITYKIGKWIDEKLQPWLEEQTPKIIKAVVGWVEDSAEAAGEHAPQIAWAILKGLLGASMVLNQAGLILGQAILIGLVTSGTVMVEAAVRMGWDVVTGIAQGIADAAKRSLDWAIELVVRTVKNGIKNGFGIFSPSKVMAGYGEQLMEGMAVGIAAGAAGVAVAATKALGPLNAVSVGPSVSPSLGRLRASSAVAPQPAAVGGRPVEISQTFNAARMSPGEIGRESVWAWKAGQR